MDFWGSVVDNPKLKWQVSTFAFALEVSIEFFGGGVGGRFFSFELPERLQVIDTSTHKAFRTSKGALPRCVPKRRMTWTLVALDVFFGHERKIFSHKFHDQSTTDKNPPVIRCLPNLVVYGSTPIRLP